MEVTEDSPQKRRSLGTYIRTCPYGKEFIISSPWYPMSLCPNFLFGPRSTLVNLREEISNRGQFCNQNWSQEENHFPNLSERCGGIAKIRFYECFDVRSIFCYASVKNSVRSQFTQQPLHRINIRQLKMIIDKTSLRTLCRSKRWFMESFETLYTPYVTDDTGRCN